MTEQAMQANRGRGNDRTGTIRSRGQRILVVVFLLALSAVFAGLLGRLFHIQVLEHERYVAAGQESRTGTDTILAHRGDVRLRDGVILARDVLSYEIGLDPCQVTREDLPLLVKTVCDALGHPAERRRRLLEMGLSQKESGGGYVRMDTGVTPEVAATLENSVLESPASRGLVLTPGTSRVYPRGTSLGQVVGVTDVDGRGIEGIECHLDGYLAARPGRRQVIRDALQKARMYFPENAEVPPVHGYNVELTIDTRIQGILEEELQTGLERHQAAGALGVVMDCRTGAILAMASLPGYDPNQYMSYPPEERNARRMNRVVEYLYEPGSVIKPFIASRVFETGLHGRFELLWEGGRLMRLPGRTVRDVRDHGRITGEEAVVYSSNIGMSILGLKLGKEGLIDTLERFGFCRKTGIELPGERAGYHRDRKKWREVFTTVSISFGYALQVSPIQLAAAFSALVNGGYLLRPHIVSRMTRGGEEIVVRPEVVGRPISEATSMTMREILHRVVREGTGRYLQLEGLEFGGKTGTADMDPLYTKTDYLASFEAFAPLEDPRFVILVMVEKPRAGRYYGGVVAGPVVGRVLARVFDVEPKADSIVMRY